MVGYYLLKIQDRKTNKTFLKVQNPINLCQPLPPSRCHGERNQNQVATTIKATPFLLQFFTTTSIVLVSTIHMLCQIPLLEKDWLPNYFPFVRIQILILTQTMVVK